MFFFYIYFISLLIFLIQKIIILPMRSPISTPNSLHTVYEHVQIYEYINEHLESSYTSSTCTLNVFSSRFQRKPQEKTK